MGASKIEGRLNQSIDAEAGASSVESVQLEQLEGPQKEIERMKKQADDLERERQSNIKLLRP